ncbi:hypothetical protein C8R45DRAFT_1093188 [Mycena sanguinolenta]|nr:hypothetical protein C8R45DRAFT_1093188 [Mycena sanguinolenta]
MLQYQEFAAWVCIDGIVVPEYGIEVSDDQKSVTCWIPSQLGKKFSVHWKNMSYDCDTRGRVYVDGNDSGALVIRARNLPASAAKLGVTDAISVMMKPFVFSSSELTDDDAFLGGPSCHELGLIELQIHAIKDAQQTLTPSIEFCTSLAKIKVHERSKKAITQQISLAEPELLKKPQKILNYRLGAELVRFSFRYRPADVLRANGIIPSLQQLKRKASSETLREPLMWYDEADTERGKMLCERLNDAETKRHKAEEQPRMNAVDNMTQNRKKVKRQRRPVQAEIIDLT